MVNKQIIKAQNYIKKTYPRITSPDLSYFILFSPRSGSNFLATSLEKAELGHPVEAFSGNPNARRRRNWGIDFSDPAIYMETAIAKQIENGAMGMKMNSIQFKFFLNTARQLLGPDFSDLTDPEVTEVFFPNLKYIHIQRKKKVKQAISLAKALQNGIWTEEEGQDAEYKKYLLPTIYDRDHIECCFDDSLSMDIFWQHYLRKNQLVYLPIFYEDLTANYTEKMKEVFTFLGVKNREVPSPKLRRQSNQQSENWEDRFVAETPWLKDPEIVKAYDEGDLESLYYLRCRMIISGRENARWRSMPATRFKKIRSFAFRVRRKFSSIFTQS